jgi:hypothetical protein
MKSVYYLIIIRSYAVGQIFNQTKEHPLFFNEEDYINFIVNTSQQIKALIFEVTLE